MTAQASQPRPFVVRWAVDVDAANPVDAARQALAMQRDPTSTATVFDIRADDAWPDAGPAEGWQEIDLADLDRLAVATRPLDEQLDAAKREHRAASERLAVLLARKAATLIRAAFPTAQRAWVTSDWSADGLSISIRELVDRDGAVLADDDEQHTEEFADLLDEVEPLLGWYGELDDEATWLTEEEFEVAVFLDEEVGG